jgi:hypothetical protein
MPRLEQGYRRWREFRGAASELCVLRQISDYRYGDAGRDC